LLGTTQAHLTVSLTLQNTMTMRFFVDADQFSLKLLSSPSAPSSYAQTSLRASSLLTLALSSLSAPVLHQSSTKASETLTLTLSTQLSSDVLSATGAVITFSPLVFKSNVLGSCTPSCLTVYSSSATTVTFQSLCSTTICPSGTTLSFSILGLQNVDHPPLNQASYSVQVVLP
jgi:hypothetical protein